MAMRAGKLRHRVSVERDTPTTDSDGHETPVWAEVAPAWASIEPAEGREFLAGAAVVGRQPVDIEMRYDSRFAAMAPDKWRIVHSGVTYDLISVVNVAQRNVKFAILAATGTAMPNE